MVCEDTRKGVPIVHLIGVNAAIFSSGPRQITGFVFCVRLLRLSCRSAKNHHSKSQSLNLAAFLAQIRPFASFSPYLNYILRLEQPTVGGGL